MSSPAEAITLPSTARWSVRVVHSDHPKPLLEVDVDRVCATASIGKVLLLVTVAERVESGELRADAQVSRANLEPVADSGLWQHLDVDHLSVPDLCALVGATSDNLATNALIALVGLDAVTHAGRRMGMTQTALHDIVRDDRSPNHPSALSSGTASDLVLLCQNLAGEREVSPAVSSQVARWLSTNTDLSMVASAFGLDPLAHVDSDRGFRLWNKTGTTSGVRCDIGVVGHGAATVTYAALANWTPQHPSDPTRDEVLYAMNEIGRLIRGSLAGSTAAVVRNAYVDPQVVDLAERVNHLDHGHDR